ncbi:MAG: PaaI family thioesterase [Candidatus Goldbacteria bacterium]|nr:PaaI family thioesterase [Candidatus Goldiibacteriota bacterium]
MTQWIDDRYCFACGEKNPIGMHLKFTINNNMIETRYVFPKELQGYKDFVHGGMISLLLDEVMVNLPWQKFKIPVVTAELKIKLRKPLKVGEEIIAKAYIEKQKGRVFIIKGKVIKEKTDELIAEAEAICFKVEAEQIKP